VANFNSPVSNLLFSIECVGSSFVSSEKQYISYSFESDIPFPYTGFTAYIRPIICPSNPVRQLIIAIDSISSIFPYVASAISVFDSDMLNPSCIRMFPPFEIASISV